MVSEKVAQEFYYRSFNAGKHTVWGRLTHDQVLLLRQIVTDVQEVTLANIEEQFRVRGVSFTAFEAAREQLRGAIPPLVIASGEWRRKDDPNCGMTDGGQWVRKVAHPLGGNEQKQNVQYYGATSPQPRDGYEAQEMVAYLARLESFLKNGK